MSAQASSVRPDEPSVSYVRADHIAADYSPARHILTTLSIAAVILSVGVALATRASATDWLLFPVFLFVANALEWTVHRFPMHRPMNPRIMYKNHAQLHHLAFTEQNMPVDSARELDLVMMPWYTMIGLFVVVSPVMVVAALVRGPGIAGVFLITAVTYFLMYEVLHASYHLPDATLARAGLRPGGLFYRLRAHHSRHHVLKRMAHTNFNVTIPFMDWVMGTREKTAAAETPAEAPSSVEPRSVS